MRTRRTRPSRRRPRHQQNNLHPRRAPLRRPKRGREPPSDRVGRSSVAVATTTTAMPSKMKSMSTPPPSPPQLDSAGLELTEDTCYSSETLSDEDSDAVSDNEREAPMDMGSESGSDEDDHNEPSLYPLEGKYKDHADKEHLQAMTEIDREAVLAERMAQIEREQQDRHLRNLLKSRNAADRAKGAAAAAASTRKSLRTKSAPKQTQEATKRGKLDELRRNREERKATGRRSSFGDEDASRRLLSDGEEDFTPEVPAKEERPIELADINLCRLGRTSLSKHLDYPDFENVAIDVFVRVTMFDKESNRNVYRMAQIKGTASATFLCVSLANTVQASGQANRTACLMARGRQISTSESPTASLSAISPWT